MTWGIFKRDTVAEAIAKKLSPITEGTVQTKKYSWGTMKHVEHGHSFSIPLHPEHHQAIHKLKSGESHSFTDETKSKWKATREGDKVHFHGQGAGNRDYKTTVKHDDLKESVELTEQELDVLINEVLTADQPAGKWIDDFVKSDNPKFAGKSKEKRKQMALAAYYAAQKKESTDYESFLVLDEANQGDIVKMGAKEIKHANMKDKQDEAEVMEPHSQGEADFLDKHSVNVTDDPTQSKQDSGKVGTATKPVGKGPGSYNADQKLSDKDKATYKEDASCEEDNVIDEGVVEESSITEETSCKKGSKKTFSSFKKEMK